MNYEPDLSKYTLVNNKVFSQATDFIRYFDKLQMSDYTVYSSRDHKGFALTSAKADKKYIKYGLASEL